MTTDLSILIMFYILYIFSINFITFSHTVLLIMLSKFSYCVVNNVEFNYEFNFSIHTLCWLFKVSLVCSYDFYNPLLFNQLRGRIIQSGLFSLQDTFSEWGNGPKSKLEFGVIDLFCLWIRFLCSEYPPLFSDFYWWS